MNAGSAYIFRNLEDGWVEVEKIVASDRAIDDNFGDAVSISGNYAIVGAKMEDNDTTDANFMHLAGSAYFFHDPNATPVELTSFIANEVDGSVVLNWTTATEVNNYGFDVETKRASSDKWETISFVNGHGNSNSPKEYSFIDTSTLLSASVSVAERSRSYRLKQLDTDGGFEYSDVVVVETNILSKTELHQNHPNPFNPSTQISYTLANAGLVNISVYNALGQKVAELVNKGMNAGTHNIEFNANNFASGLYFYRIETANYSKTMKMLLIK